MVWRRSLSDNSIAAIRAQLSPMPIAEAEGAEARPLGEPAYGDRVPTEADRSLLRIAREKQRVLKSAHIAQYVAAAECVAGDSHTPPASGDATDRESHVDDRTVAHL